MSLESTLLRKLAETKPNADRQELTVSEGAWTAHLTLERRDELSGRLWEAAVHRRGAGTDTVATWAERIAGRVVGLLEPLKVVEVDAVKQEALLRSKAPTARGDDVFYYEIHLRGLTSAVLRRYQASLQVGTKRAQIAFALTNESLAKLVGDLVAEK